MDEQDESATTTPPTGDDRAMIWSTPTSTAAPEPGDNGASRPAFVSQDEDHDDEPPTAGPVYNTRAQTHSITQDCMCAVLELSSATFTPRSTSARKYPLQFLCKFTGAVLNKETGDMMEYRHLMQNPKYR